MEIKKQFSLPTTQDRVAIMGRTGSGKTQFGSFLLSEAPFDRQPYIIVDYKGDDLINQIDRAKEIGLNELPRHPGIYIVRPQPEQDDVAVEAWLRRVWSQQRTGLFVDEAYMVPTKGGAFNAILTQGRSKHIPAIVLTQRPCFISRFVFTEADHFAIFHLTDKDDRLKVRRFLPDGTQIDRMPLYNSYWYNVKGDALFKMRPAPDADSILNRFDERLAPRRKAL
jgi:DNA helicase HerA-like ATPase